MWLSAMALDLHMKGPVFKQKEWKSQKRNEYILTGLPT